MTGNTFGQAFSVTTFGESHGIAMGAIVDGCPPNMGLTESDLMIDLNRRKPGRSQYTTQRMEDDQVEILSGVFEGKTTGTPIGLVIRNKDQRSRDYSQIKDIYRPAHADFTYDKKYGIRDYRGGGRASARETAMRVAAGGIAKKYLRENFGTRIRGFLAQVGEIQLELKSLDHANESIFFSPDPDRETEISQFIEELRSAGDSIGAKIGIVASDVPVGLGEPVFSKLDADLASSLMGINAVKGVEIGDGFSVVKQRGSEHRDEMSSQGFQSNRSGGTLGGISTGQDIHAFIALKPTSSIATPGKSVDRSNKNVEVVTKGRHDPCVGLRAVPIAEAMVALVLMDHVMRDRAQNLRVASD